MHVEADRWLQWFQEKPSDIYIEPDRWLQWLQEPPRDIHVKADRWLQCLQGLQEPPMARDIHVHTDPSLQ